jgi:hypothetical protein
VRNKVILKKQRELFISEETEAKLVKKSPSALLEFYEGSRCLHEKSNRVNFAFGDSVKALKGKLFGFL